MESGLDDDPHTLLAQIPKEGSRTTWSDQEGIYRFKRSIVAPPKNEHGPLIFKCRHSP